MFFATLMLLVSLLLVFMEFYLPGGILGTAGGVIFIVSLFIFSSHCTTIWPIIAFVGAAVLLLGCTIKFAMWRLAHMGGKAGMYADEDQAGFQATSFHEEAVGKVAIVVTSLRPSGYVEVEGSKYQAVSKFGFVEKGKTVEVVGGDGGHLIVRPQQEKSK